MDQVKYVTTDDTAGLLCSGLSAHLYRTEVVLQIWAKTGTNLQFPAPNQGLLFQKGEEDLHQKAKQPLQLNYIVLLLNTGIISNKAKSQCRKSFQMVQRYKIGFKTSEIGEESCPFWDQNDSDYKLSEKSVFYLRLASKSKQPPR